MLVVSVPVCLGFCVAVGLFVSVKRLAGKIIEWF